MWWFIAGLVIMALITACAIGHAGANGKEARSWREYEDRKVREVATGLTAARGPSLRPTTPGPDVRAALAEVFVIDPALRDALPLSEVGEGPFGTRAASGDPRMKSEIEALLKHRDARLAKGARDDEDKIVRQADIVMGRW